MTTRNKYSKEFKLDAISLVLEQGYIAKRMLLIRSARRVNRLLSN